MFPVLTKEEVAGLVDKDGKSTELGQKVFEDAIGKASVLCGLTTEGQKKSLADLYEQMAWQILNPPKDHPDWVSVIDTKVKGNIRALADDKRKGWEVVEALAKAGFVAKAAAPSRTGAKNRNGKTITYTLLTLPGFERVKTVTRGTTWNF